MVEEEYLVTAWDNVRKEAIVNFREEKTNLGSLRDSVLGKLTRQDETDRGLDLTRRDSRLLVVGGKLGSLGSNPLKDV